MTSIEEAVVALRDCWCAALDDTVATCCITAGIPVIVECCAGYAWVRLIGAYPSQAFPQQLATAERCRIDTWALQVEIGVARCAAEPCDMLGAPCCEQELVAAVELMEDFARARRVFTCCLTDTLRSDEIIPGAWKVSGPEGGCIVSTMNATLFISDPCGC